jgi:steroid 5-alpha reductase family enzyme
MYLVLRHGTGVPMLEASMLQRKGEAFRDYQKRVNVFFPSLLAPPR